MDLLRFIILICTLSSRRLVDATFFHRALGAPFDCRYRETVRPCMLAFNCWLQGGRHGGGCGGNQWLFACCIFDQSPARPNEKYTSGSLKKGGPPYPAQKSAQVKNPNAIRRRMDNNLLQVSCGIPRTENNVLQRRIIGGRPAEFAEFAWQAHIRIAEYQCGGVLITNNFVATAAHCIKYARLKEIIVYLGELDTQNSGNVIEPLPVEKHYVVQKIVHPKFRFRMTQPDRFDIALLRLARPAGYRSHIFPICLPSEPVPLVGVTGVIAGWGKTDVSSGQTGTNILRTAMVPIISRSKCVEWHERKQIDIDLYPEMLCAGHADGHQDACLGDSGGPLIVLHRGRYYLVGITSAGFGCGIDQQPGIYLNVQKVLGWLQSVVQGSYVY